MALVAAFVAVAAAARSRTRATATALDEMGDVCLVHVAAGDTFLEVSKYTLPSKLAYAEKYGYRVLHYAATPTCCDAIDSYACTLPTVQYKYCALRDALTTGGQQSASGSSGLQMGLHDRRRRSCLTPDAPSLDTLVPDPSLVAILSAGTEIYTPSLTTQTLESGLFNSGAMIWRNTDRALAAIDAVLHFDDASTLVKWAAPTRPWTASATSGPSAARERQTPRSSTASRPGCTRRLCSARCSSPTDNWRRTSSSTGRL